MSTYGPSTPDDVGYADPEDGGGELLHGEGSRHDLHRRQREKRRNRRVLVAALVLLLVPVLAVGGYLVWLNQIVSSNIKQEQLLPDVPGPTNDAGEAIEQPAGNGTNYLLLGSDAGPGRVGGRSDVMVLVHVPEDKHNVTLIHFPRDLYVSIPDHGKNKLNAAFAFGGSPLLVQTMQNLLGVEVDHVAMVDFEGFKRMTDAVGGVDVKVEEASTGNGVTFNEGTMHMDGETALIFVRQRKQLSEGDISRGRRQQAFIKALMLKTLSAETLTNPIRLKDFIDAATSNLIVDQDLDVGTMRSEAFSMKGLRGRDVRFITAPFTGFGTSPEGASIDIVDEAGMDALGEAIRTDTVDDYED
ncbi:LCP family protein [Intrasporangium calvum]|uniref:Cell envelope-related transcriptional attenuator n=1 Tax=Intrasporangium calvum (strain ATCC 23552 / DSM 43043 / JCM 3097 / NBRC 12989 / NCIMB 10167 / NRRL B-3866 / 7 KIP) TaxID=710696 RepID=E6SER4_INTC7|nr:LCP family protein [Intrasporangium calvum]ADU47671.1 cell envelope-related transcriptional attenuator [Intrasporangium calvum DSM 43043]